MDRSPADRLPTDRIPGLGSDDETDSESTQLDSDASDELDVTADAFDAEVEDSDEKPPLRARLRTLLLGVSLGGIALAVLAALLRRILGDGDESEDTSDPATDAEPTAETETVVDSDNDGETTETDEEVDLTSELLTADAEGAAAMVGLGFNLLVRALVDDEPDGRDPS